MSFASEHLECAKRTQAEASGELRKPNEDGRGEFAGMDLLPDLPSHVIHLILQDMPTKDILKCIRLSKAWRQEGLLIIYDRGWKDYAHLKASHHMVCELCGINRAKQHKYSHLPECKDCKDIPTNQFVARKNAVEKYGAKESFLNNLDKTQHYGPKANGKLLFRMYRIKDILAR
ncbi:hypothetical protein WJX74_006876 [Apatococcus lobatus]|uniref:F-box domain-containing protein n=1 Tax=Apatococcus lobatus TaxID=904363 RepID=A0AAW1QN65_9CHLO